MAKPDPLPPRPRWLLPVTLVALLLVCGVSFYLWRLATSLGDGGVAAIGGPFALVDQHDRPVTDRDFRGKVMLVYFGYTFCPDVCPTTLSHVGHALDELRPAELAQIAPLFITVDPSRDTPAHLADYVANFHPALVGLTGSQEALDKVEHEYRVYAKRVDEPNGSYSMDHSSIIYVMGRDGRFLGIIPDTAGPDEIAADLRKDL